MDSFRPKETPWVSCTADSGSANFLTLPTWGTSDGHVDSQFTQSRCLSRGSSRLDIPWQEIREAAGQKLQATVAKKKRIDAISGWRSSPRRSIRCFQAEGAWGGSLVPVCTYAPYDPPVYRLMARTTKTETFEPAGDTDLPVSTSRGFADVPPAGTWAPAADFNDIRFIPG